MLNYRYIKHRLRERKNLNRLIRKGKISGDIDFFFIISAGRSGSTLLRKHLQLESNVYIPPESEDFIPKVVNLFAENLDDYNRFVSEMTQLVSQMQCLKVWSLTEEGVRMLLLNIPEKDRQIDKIILIIYKNEIPFECQKNCLLGDKTPLLNDYLELISKIFPKGKLIYMVRDGRGVVNSYVQSRNYTVKRAVMRWKSALANFNSKKHFFSDKLIIVKYEDFILHPDQKIDEVLKLLGQKRNSGSKEKTAIDMGDTYLSHHSNIQNPINAKSLEKWREELTFETIQELNILLKNELETFQYKK